MTLKGTIRLNYLGSLTIRYSFTGRIFTAGYAQIKTRVTKRHYVDHENESVELKKNSCDKTIAHILRVMYCGYCTPIPPFFPLQYSIICNYKFKA
jgi:hypothetical protein